MVRSSVCFIASLSNRLHPFHSCDQCSVVALFVRPFPLCFPTPATGKETLSITSRPDRRCARVYFNLNPGQIISVLSTSGRWQGYMLRTCGGELCGSESQSPSPGWNHLPGSDFSPVNVAPVRLMDRGKILWVALLGGCGYSLQCSRRRPHGSQQRSSCGSLRYWRAKSVCHAGRRRARRNQSTLEKEEYRAIGVPSVFAIGCRLDCRAVTSRSCDTMVVTSICALDKPAFREELSQDHGGAREESLADASGWSLGSPRLRHRTVRSHGPCRCFCFYFLVLRHLGASHVPLPPECACLCPSR